MGKIIAIANQEELGKQSVNLAASLGVLEKKVYLLMLIHKQMLLLVRIDVESVEIGTYQILEHSHTPKKQL
jgi:chromosome partitioning protein